MPFIPAASASAGHTCRSRTCGFISCQDAFSRRHDPLSDIAELLLLLSTQERIRVSHVDWDGDKKEKRPILTYSDGDGAEPHHMRTAPYSPLLTGRCLQRPKSFSLKNVAFPILSISSLSQMFKSKSDLRRLF